MTEQELDAIEAIVREAIAAAEIGYDPCHLAEPALALIEEVRRMRRAVEATGGLGSLPTPLSNTSTWRWQTVPVVLRDPSDEDRARCEHWPASRI